MAETRGTASRSDDTLPVDRGTALARGNGRTVIADVVVAKIAGIAAREVPGVHALVAQGAGAAIAGLTQRVIRADHTTQGVRVEVGEREAAIDLRLTVDYGASIPQVADAVRQNVIDRIQSMTGLVVKEVNIEVSDLFFPGEEAPPAERRVGVAAGGAAMNLFNRALVLLLCLLVLGGGSAVLLVIAGTVAPEHFALLPGATQLLACLPELTGPDRGRVLLVTTLSVFGALVLVLLELWPRPREPRIELSRGGLGAVTIALEGVREIASRAAAGVAEVREARAQVDRDAKGLRVRCRVSVDPEASLPEVTRTLQERVKEAVEHHLGQEVTEVRVEARAPSGLDRRPSARVR